MANIITIRETGFSDGKFDITVSFNHEYEHETSVQNPFSKKQEEHLRWYFEDFLKFPFVDTVKAGNVAKSIYKYGEDLFEQVLGQREVFAEYNDFKQSGISDIVIEIIGTTPEFHSIHWETMKDPKLPNPLSVTGATVYRKNPKPPAMKANVKPSPYINLLIVTSRPGWEDDVKYRTISRPLVELIEKGRLKVKPHVLRPGTFKALSEHLKEVKEGFYHIVHFDCHGALAEYESLMEACEDNELCFQSRWGLSDLEKYDGYKGFLFFESDEKGKPVPVEASEIADLLIYHKIPVCILNACQSAMVPGESQLGLSAELMKAGMQFTLGMGYSVTVSAAEKMMKHLYEDLFSGKTPRDAVSTGRFQLYNNKNRKANFQQVIELEDWMLPVIYQSKKVTMNLREFTPDEEDKFYSEREKEYKLRREPRYGFVGRDLDFLTIEKKLLKHNILLLRGMGGSGKSTLLDQLAQWWEKTDFVRGSFYFGYDERAHTLEQILFYIGKKIYNEREFAIFQSSKFHVQKHKIIDRLKSECCCLILDNCESITGSPLSVKNTLNDDEQAKLRDFIRELSGGKSFVLIGSRGAEDWLKEGTFGDKEHNLKGLDKEARSDLAKRILDRNNIEFPKDDDDFKRLMKMLAGFPLAMEVILPNLKTKTPEKIVENLKEANVELDKPGGKDKTDSIVKCVEYSYNQLSEEAQRLLLVFAPFTGVINLSFLDNYIKELNKFDEFKDITLESLKAVINEAVNWGLMEPEQPGSSILNLQPVFPFFLNMKLMEIMNEIEWEHLMKTFMNLYKGISYMIFGLFESKKPEEKMIAPVLAGMEYENIWAALEIALERKESFTILSGVLDIFFDSIQDHERGLKAGQYILSKIEKYPEELLQEKSGIELAGVFSRVAYRFLLTKKYKKARDSYEKALDIWNNNTSPEEEGKRKLSAAIYHHLGIVFQNLRDFAEAKNNYQKALEIFVELNDRHSQASMYHQLGNVFFELRDFANAKKSYQKALKIYVEFDDRYEQALTYHQLGYVFHELRDFAKAKKNYFKALEINIEFDDRYGQALTYHQLGNVFLEFRDFAEAKNNYQKALEIYIKYNVLYEQAKEYHQLGMVAEELRDFAEAKNNYQKALEIYVKFDDRHSQAGTYHQLGCIFQALRYFEEAKKNYQKALEIFIEFDDRHSQATTYYQLASIAEDLRDFAEAKKNYQKALEIEIEFNDRYSQASTYQQLGMVAQELRNFAEAKKNYQKALEIKIEFNDQHSQASTYHQLGRFSEELRDFAEAKKNYQKALEIYMEFNDWYEQAKEYHHLGIVAQELRDFAEAKKNYQKALEIFIEFNDRYSQAGTYHNLCAVFQELRDFEEAKKNYQKALEIFIEFDDKYAMAKTIYAKGLMYKEMEDHKEARKNWEKAIELFNGANAKEEAEIVRNELRSLDK